MIPQFVSAQHDNPYFHWQIEVYVNNFIEKGIPPENINILLAVQPSQNKPSKWARSFQVTSKVNVHFYVDIRERKHYIPSIKPFLVHEWLKEDPSRGDTFFLHDSDIIFNSLPDLKELCGGKVNYLSDSISYIGHEYLTTCSKYYEKQHSTLAKGRLIEEMAKVIGISANIIKENQMNSGGAQYLLKEQTPAMWLKMYNDSITLYDTLLAFDKSFPIKNGNIQSWTAEMWSILWNLWFFEQKTRISDKLSFSWATDSMETFRGRPIFHLSGATHKDRERIFYKGDFINKNPIELLRANPSAFDYVDPENATSAYMAAIKEVTT